MSIKNTDFEILQHFASTVALFESSLERLNVEDAALLIKLN
jgi:hypothetical protein